MEETKMEEKMTKKESILKVIEKEVESNTSSITEIFQIISNFEEVLECSYPEGPREKTEEPTTRLDKLRNKLYNEHIDLLTIRDRLVKLKENFGN